MKTLQDILNICRENDVEIIDFKMTDIDGRWRHLCIPASRLNEDTLRYGIGFDGSNYGYANVEKSDMVFIPDLDSAVLDPFTEVPTLSMIGDVMVIDLPNNRPFNQYPRNVVKAALDYMKKTGIADELVIGPEYEFYIFDGVRFDNQPSYTGYEIDCEQAEWNSGSEMNNAGYIVGHKKNYHNVLPLDVNADLRNEMCLTLEDMGVKVKYHHCEVGGCGQMEIEVVPDQLLKLADGTMTAKYVIKNTAYQAGKTATFMPKPVAGEAGSGMHVHLQLFKDGAPVFYDEAGYAQLSETAMHFIGGLLKHAPSLCAITNPTTNSYKRLVPGFEAPVTIGYAMSNRSAVIRIPAYAKAPKDKRFELRNPDASCNPYYAYAAILMAGLDGIQNKIDPHAEGWGPFDCNLWELPAEERARLGGLPHSLTEACRALESDRDFLTAGGVFPAELLDLMVRRELREDDLVNRAPHPKEFEMYYDL